MSSYLRSRFPLQSTSTVYMDGTAAYNLVQYSRPGIIASVVLSAEKAQLFRDAVREACADAWDEGHSQRMGEHAVNPYRTPTQP